ncbi:MAG: M48 family metallopeptidase [Dehalococcoidales bacterium]|nr:M48 family metallopeptidase [Dehalococcoidales bacterium]
MGMIRETRPRLTVVGKRETILDGQAVPYIIKHSPKAKYVRLEVRPQTGLTVVIPKSYKLTQLPSLLREKRQWILAKLAKYGQLKLLSTEKEVKSGDTIPYLGQDLQVVKQQNHGEADNIRLERKRLVVSLKSANARLNLVLEGWYRRQAENLIRKRANELCARLGVTYGRLSIRGAKTRWGSCSQKGNLNFNWKLMMAPEPVINYVIIHEIAHLKEMNHTEKFWKLVSEHCPQWRKHKRWLKDHEAELSAKLSS